MAQNIKIIRNNLIKYAYLLIAFKACCLVLAFLQAKLIKYSLKFLINRSNIKLLFCLTVIALIWSALSLINIFINYNDKRFDQVDVNLCVNNGQSFDNTAMNGARKFSRVISNACQSLSGNNHYNNGLHSFNFLGINKIKNNLGNLDNSKVLNVFVKKVFINFILLSVLSLIANITLIRYNPLLAIDLVSYFTLYLVCHYLADILIESIYSFLIDVKNSEANQVDEEKIQSAEMFLNKIIKFLDYPLVFINTKIIDNFFEKDDIYSPRFIKINENLLISDITNLTHTLERF